MVTELNNSWKAKQGRCLLEKKKGILNSTEEGKCLPWYQKNLWKMELSIQVGLYY